MLYLRYCTITAILAREKNRKQIPVYFVHHVTICPDLIILNIEKLAFIVIMEARKLTPDFEAH